MNLPADYHMHTPLCRHAEGEPAEYAAAASRAGFTEIGFSDHSPMPEDDFDDWRMLARDLDAYVRAVEAAREAFPSLTIRLGLEVDYLPGCESWVHDLAGRYQWDYLIGSVHYIPPRWAIDSPYETEHWKTVNVLDVWKRYCDLLTEAAASGLFNILAHPDLCKKFGFYPETDCSELFRPVFKAACAAGVAVELNTAGLRKPCREIYPSSRVLTVARQEQVGITFGSDAHSPGEVGMDFAEAIRLAREAGFDQWQQFNRRSRLATPLPIVSG